MTSVAVETRVVVLTERNSSAAFAEDMARNRKHRIFGRFDSVHHALDACRLHHVGVLVAEVGTFGRLRELEAFLPAGQVAAVVVSELPAEAALLTLMAAGARGFLRKPLYGGLLDCAVTAAATGHEFVDPRSTGWLLELALHGQRGRPDHGLTLRQSQVVELVRGGLTNREIARVLGISLATVKSHLHRAMRRLGADNRWAATVLAERLREERHEVD